MAEVTKLGTAQIPIRATLDELDNDLAGARGKVEGALGGIADLGVIALGAALASVKEIAGTVVDTFKQIFEFGEQGAQIIQLRESFQHLIGSGEAAAAMEREIAEATHDAIDGEDAQAIVLQMLTGSTGVFADKVKETVPQLFQMAAASAKLNPMMGSTTQIMQSMAQSLEMGNVRGLKRLGIIISAADSEATYAKSIGKTVKELDEEEVKVAHLNAALEYLPKLMGQVGGSTESAVDPFNRMKVALDDVSDVMKEQFAPAIAAAADAIALALTASKKLDDALAEHGSQMFKTTTAYEDYITEMQRAYGVAGIVVDATGKQTKSFYNQATGQTMVIESQIAMTREAYELTKATEEGTTATDESVRSLARQAGAAASSAGAQDLLKSAMKDLGLLLAGPIGKETTDYANKQEDLRKKLSEIGAELGKLQGTHGAIASSQTENEMSAEELALAQAKVGTATEDLSKATKEADETDAEFVLRVAEMRNQIAGQNEKLGEANREVVEYVDNSKKIGELKSEYAEVNAALAENATAHDEATKRILFDLLSQRAAVNGLTSDELVGLTKIAVQWGLVDEKTANAVSGMDASLATLAANSDIDAFVDKVRNIKNAADDARIALFNMSDIGTSGAARRREEREAATGGGGGISDDIGGGGLKGKRHGGDVMAGMAYLLGEEQPEIFVPDTAGRIIPNGQQFLNQLNSAMRRIVQATATSVSASMENVSELVGRGNGGSEDTYNQQQSNVNISVNDPLTGALVMRMFQQQERGRLNARMG